LVPWWDEFLKVNGDYVEVWHVKSAINMPCTHRSRNKFSASECWLPHFFKLLSIKHKTNHHLNIATFNLPFYTILSHSLGLSARASSLKYGYS
jgi:hypothetical protein